MKTFFAPAYLRVQPVAGLPASIAAEYSQAQAAHAPGPVRSRVQKAALILLTLGGSFLAHPILAQQAQPVKVEKANATTFRVRIQDPSQQAGRVRVVSLGTGQTLYDERYNAPAYGHAFDFQNVREGNYMLVMQMGQTKYRYTVQVKKQPQVSVALRTVTVKTRLPKLSSASASLPQMASVY
jgi:hypothetical protein